MEGKKKPSGMTAGRHAWGSVPTCGKLAKVGCTLAKLGQETMIIIWGDGEAPSQGQDQRKGRGMSQHTHILRLPDTTVTKKNKFLPKSSVATPKYNADDKDNELPLDYMVTPKKVTP